MEFLVCRRKAKVPINTQVGNSLKNDKRNCLKKKCLRHIFGHTSKVYMLVPKSLVHFYQSSSVPTH